MKREAALAWKVEVMLKGRRYPVRACSEKEAVYIRTWMENRLGAVGRKGKFGWGEFCFPDPVDCSGTLREHILLVCGRRFRLREPWTPEKEAAILAGNWFSYCRKLPHCCLLRMTPKGGFQVLRIPLDEVVGKVTEQFEQSGKKGRKPHYPDQGKGPEESAGSLEPSTQPETSTEGPPTEYR